LIVDSDPSGAEVVVDGASAGVTGERPVVVAGIAAGAHRVEVALDGHDPWTRQVRVGAGEEVEVRARLRPTAAEPAPAPASADAKTGWQRTWGWTALGVGAAAVGVGVAFGMVAQSKAAELEDAQDRSRNFSRAGADIESSGERAETIQIAGLVVGGVARAPGAARRRLVVAGEQPAAAAAPGGLEVRF
jgi:hypothetical protein